LEPTADLPHIDHFVWDGWNREHITKHGVRPDEAEEVVAGEPYVRETYKQRLHVVGPTATGRILSIVIGAVPDQPSVYYVFSARPASRKERSNYDQQRGGLLP
jgi:uncharacterized DUF497 family protein